MPLSPVQLRNLSRRTDENGQRPICRHCHTNPVNRPRGLCWSCYYAPGVAALYPPTSKFSRRGTANFPGSAKLGDPTDALPGTPEKVVVMAQRSGRGEELFHPLDVGITGERQAVMDRGGWHNGKRGAS